MRREPVTLQPRKRFTPAQRAAVFASRNGECHEHGGPVREPWDVEHRIPLALGGTNAPENLDPICARPWPCHAAKTARDSRAIAKAKRLAGETCTRAKRPIRSRGFDRTRTRGFDGQVRERAS